MVLRVTWGLQDGNAQDHRMTLTLPLLGPCSPGPRAEPLFPLHLHKQLLPPYSRVSGWASIPFLLPLFAGLDFWRLVQKLTPCYFSKPWSVIRAERRERSLILFCALGLPSMSVPLQGPRNSPLTAASGPLTQAPNPASSLLELQKEKRKEKR